MKTKTLVSILHQFFLHYSEIDKEILLDVLIKISAKVSLEENDEKLKRPPVNLVIVLDVSGSMEGKPLDMAKAAIRMIVNNLGEDDLIHLVTYESRSEIFFKNKNAKDKEQMNTLIDKVRSGGCTNMMSGMKLAWDLLKESKCDRLKQVFLFTDGMVNEGVRQPKKIYEIIEDYKKKDGIVTNAFGLGTDYNGELMKNIAEISSGIYYYIDKPKEIEHKFSNAFGLISSVVLRETKLFLNGDNDDCVITKVYGVDDINVLKGEGIQVGQMYNNDERVFLCQVKLNLTKFTPKEKKDIEKMKDSKHDFFSLKIQAIDCIKKSDYTVVCKSAIGITSDEIKTKTSKVDEVFDRKVIAEVVEDEKKIVDFCADDKGDDAKDLIKSCIEKLSTIETKYLEAKILMKQLKEDLEKLENENDTTAVHQSAQYYTSMSTPCQTPMSFM